MGEEATAGGSQMSGGAGYGCARGALMLEETRKCWCVEMRPAHQQAAIDLRRPSFPSIPLDAGSLKSSWLGVRHGTGWRRK